MPTSFDETTVELPDGTEVYISLGDESVHYRVIDVSGDVLDDVSYTYDDARHQARTIREREAASWDTVFPEQAEPVLDVARTLLQAADALDEVA